jgi:hypothetical protein
MPKKINKSTLIGKNLRIQFIHEFILNKQGNRQELLKFVNKKLSGRNLDEISVKMLDKDLKDLNEGNFPGAERTLKRDSSGKIYFAEYNRTSGTYEYRNGTPIPAITFMSEDERMTLPFMKGLLDSYGQIPSIQKLIDESQALFDLNMDEVDTSKIFVVKKPSYSDKSRSGKMIERTIKLLNHINKNEVLLIKYSESNKLEYVAKRELESSTFLICPLSVRMHDGLYYLTALSQKESKSKKTNKWIIRTFRIDFIASNGIKNVPDPERPHLHQTFNAEEIWVQYEVQKNMDKAIGIWNFHEDSIEEEVRIRFFGWAASYIKLFQLHSSQIIYNTDIENDFVDVQFKFYTYPKFRVLNAKNREKQNEYFQRLGLTDRQFPNVQIFDRYPEAGYLLGKFINFMCVLP